MKKIALALSILCLFIAAPSHAAVMSINVESYGFEDSRPSLDEFAVITVNGGENLALNGRGFNVVTLDEVTGTVLDSRVFDTHASVAESIFLNDYLLGLPVGRIVLIAVGDEGANNLPGFFDSLFNLGAPSTAFDSFGYRSSWALIGIQGAAPGSQPWSSDVRNSNGSIVSGTIEIPNSIATVPEPSTLLLFLLGAVSVVSIRKLKTSK